MMCFKRWSVRATLGLLVACNAFCIAGRALAEGGRPVVVVTTYVTDTQKERKDTRFTLTEWLRIKEHMKEMDVWLAMFSDPAKDTFRPEVDLTYGQTKGNMTVVPESGSASSEATGALTGKQWAGQLWLTNLVSSKFGIRTLNVDLGGEGGVRRTGAFEPDGIVEDLSWTRDMERQYWSMDFRVFGRNIQDSSLVFKLGRYGSRNRIARDADHVDMKVDRQGLMAGAQMHLYLLSWLGLEGSYTKFGGKSALDASEEATGVAWDGMAYIEVSLFRLMVGRYGETWNWPVQAAGADPVTRATLKESGLMAGIKVML